ncbi:MAG TPA: hypothetical protein VGL23_05305 [Chloroflexota bacterium]|jgi:predicted kinase
MYGVVEGDRVRARPLLVVLSGVPGTGKSTVGEHAARLLGCPLFAKDVLEAALRRSGRRRTAAERPAPAR